MAITYEPINTYSATGSQHTITFSSIPSTYTDLVLIIAGNTTNLTAAFRFNNDTGTNYSRLILRGDGSSVTTAVQSNQSYIAIDGSYSQPFQNAIINIFGYKNTTTFKTALVKSNNASSGLDQGVGLWRDGSAINRIDVLSTGATNWLTGTTFTLYGIKAA